MWRQVRPRAVPRLRRPVGHSEFSKCYPRSTWQNPFVYRTATIEFCGRAIVYQGFQLPARHSHTGKSGGTVIALTGLADETNTVGFPKTRGGSGAPLSSRSVSLVGWAKP